MGKRWLGKPHAIKVKANPLHYSSRIESCLECLRCERVLHYSAYRLASGATTKVCQECRDALAAKHAGGLP